MAVVVFGSINMDLIGRAPRLPGPGETLSGHAFFTAPGGKGANQAVAAARLGALTKMVGRVGEDVFGPALRESLQGYGVDIGGVLTDPDQPSGIAMIAVDDQAENSILIIPGANGEVGHEDLARLDAALEGASVLLLQLEIPMESVVEAARLARQRGVRVILDPAPAYPLPEELYGLVDLLTPNESEAAALTGIPVHDTESAERAARLLVERGARASIIKMGSRGVYLFDGQQGKLWPAFAVEAVDTVAAGDAFNGALAAALDEGHTLDGAIPWALAAGALAVTKAGAQPAMPERREVLALLRERGLAATGSTKESKQAGA